MMYAQVIDGAVVKYPYTFSDLRRDNPDVSFSRVGLEASGVAAYGVVPVAPVTKPTPSATERVTEGAPALVGDVWTQTWTVEDITAEIQAGKDATAVSEVDRVMGEIQRRALNVMFELINQFRASQGQSALTLPQYTTLINGASGNGPITREQFITFVRSKL